uniref:DDE_Tnp_IS1595 domain-containing protein n=1 Tax=Ascaris lumbricoides TaxID=6252 RepID=A0A0M3INZ4_ASCLU
MFIREICAYYVERRQAPLGGPGKVVEVDESVFCRRKYNRGAVREHTWMFGAVERGTANAVLFKAPDRTRATLEALISRWIRPGTIVISDMWAAYNGLSALSELLQVNCSTNFAHTVMHNGESLRVHTNTIEGLWSHAKRKFEEMLGTSKANFESYISEFMFRRMTKPSEFACLVDAVGRLYDPH